MRVRTAAEGERSAPEGRLRGWRLLARLVLGCERAWPELWPAAGVLGALAVAALLDMPAWLPAWLHFLVLAAGGLAVAGLAVRGLARVRWPDRAAADRRLERDSGLAHRPLAVLEDRLAGAEGAALWAAHRARSLAQIGRLRLGLPHPGMARRDPRALRALLVVLLVAGAVVAGPDAPARLARALHPGWSPLPAPLAVQVQAWITPPAATGLAPRGLPPGAGAPPISESVPEGTRLTVSVTGGRGTPEVALEGQALPLRTLDATSFQGEVDLHRSGRLTVRQDGRALAAWQIAVVPDSAPEVAWAEPPGQARGSGPAPATRLPWQVRHAYGVAALEAELRLPDRPGGPVLRVPLPLPGTPREARGVALRDLTAHPWAGLPVLARLVARDAAGLEGVSPEAGFLLPARIFTHPMARALAEVRRNLSLPPPDGAAAVTRLDALAGVDAVWRRDLPGYLVLRTVQAQLRRTVQAQLRQGADEAAVAEAQEGLWQLALRLEEGATGRTAAALQAAREQAREALETGDAEASARLAALEEALRRHLQALAEQAQRTGQAGTPPEGASRLNADEMLRLAEQAREAARQGRTEEARQIMADLEGMLDTLARARPGSRTASPQERQSRQEMAALRDIARRLEGMRGRAESRQRNAATPGGQALERRADGQLGAALRRGLGALMEQHADRTGRLPPPLGQADLALREALRALHSGEDSPAAAALGQALAALQQEQQEMARQLTLQFGSAGGAQGGAQEGAQPGDSPAGGADSGEALPGEDGAPADGPRDPLGRRLGEDGGAPGSGQGVHVPDRLERRRAAILQQELRRREADKTRPRPELDYLGRLLQPF